MKLLILIKVLLLLAVLFSHKTITTIGHHHGMNEYEILDKAQDIKADRGYQGTYIVIVDMTRDANEYRFFVVNVLEDKIENSLYTSHGEGSGPLRKCLQFSNVPTTKKSSKGLYRTGEVFYGEHGKSLKLDGLEKGINDDARDRDIEVHPAPYASPNYVDENGYPGRSWGCFALDPAQSSKIIDKIRDGSYLYVVSDDDTDE
jgi:hypothetical protein